MKRFSLFALLLCMAASGIGQVEEQPYFSLSSARTFGPDEKASIQLSAYNTDRLEFRVYRVNDPLKFFESLDDPHMFGGRASRPPRRRSLLESFHAWKHEWRMNFINTVRMQFDADSRAEIREWRAGKVRINRAANYAEAPLLNKEQVVSVWQQKVTTGNRWEEQTIPLEVHAKGVYLVEASNGDLRAYTIVMISDLAMIAKTSSGRVIAYVVNRQSGTPVDQCGVTLWSGKNAIQNWKTSDRGLVDRPVNAVVNDDLRLMAYSGRDFAVTTPSAYSLSTESGPKWTGYVYTDRPVYRPGHTVDFKAILRVNRPSGYTMPAAENVQATVSGPDQKTIYQKQLTISRMGTVHDQFTLPGDAALGYYSVEIRHGDQSVLQGGFQVEEYKKPEYEVRVSAAKPRILQGESVQATIDARYYFGEPVKNAKVTYAVYRDFYWSPLFYSSDDDDLEQMQAGGQEDGESAGEQILNETGQLDANGKLTVNIPTTLSQHHSDFRYRIEARVTDEANREISGTGYFVATYGSFMVNAQPDQYVYSPGSEAKIDIRARDYDNHPIQTAVKLELQTWRWNDPKAVKTVSTTQTQTDAAGNASAAVTIPRGGEWRVRVTAITPEQREVESLAYLWVNGGGADIYGGQSETIQIVPDKKSYKSGDTAKVLIVTGVPRADVLVTIEGSQIRAVQVISANMPVFTFEVPVKSSDAPSFYVTASFVQKGKLHQGNKRVKVPPVEQQLHVELATSKPQYQPGETATYNLDVTDSNGRAVPGAEFSLGVVDEAIYAIRKDTTPDILQFFYGRQYNKVATDNSLSYYFRGEAGKRRMQLASLPPRGRPWRNSNRNAWSSQRSGKRFRIRPIGTPASSRTHKAMLRRDSRFRIH